MRLFIGMLCCLLCMACTQEPPESDAPPPQAAEPSLQQQIENMYQTYKKAGFAQVPDCTPVELHSLQVADDVILIDVRSEEERAVSMIPGAISMETFHAKEWPAGKTIVVYCTIGVRSAMACMSLKNQGIPAKNLVGGVLNWTAQELPLEHAGRESKRLHTYGRRWALVPDEIEAIY